MPPALPHRKRPAFSPLLAALASTCLLALAGLLLVLLPALSSSLDSNISPGHIQRWAVTQGALWSLLVAIAVGYGALQPHRLAEIATLVRRGALLAFLSCLPSLAFAFVPEAQVFAAIRAVASLCGLVLWFDLARRTLHEMHSVWLLATRV